MAASAAVVHRTDAIALEFQHPQDRRAHGGVILGHENTGGIHVVRRDRVGGGGHGANGTDAKGPIGMQLSDSS